MLVSFYFECPLHGRFVKYLDTNKYPGRKWPSFLPCSKLIREHQFGQIVCTLDAERIPVCENFSPDSFWSGKKMTAMDKEYTSRDYFRRDLKSKGISALTEEERYSIKTKTQKELRHEYFDREDIKQRRKESIAETVSGFGVIDGIEFEGKRFK